MDIGTFGRDFLGDLLTFLQRQAAFGQHLRMHGQPLFGGLKSLGFARIDPARSARLLEQFDDFGVSLLIRGTACRDLRIEFYRRGWGAFCVCAETVPAKNAAKIIQLPTINCLGNILASARSNR